jgi:hypothetical protein
MSAWGLAANGLDFHNILAVCTFFFRPYNP